MLSFYKHADDFSETESVIFILINVVYRQASSLVCFVY